MEEAKSDWRRSESSERFAYLLLKFVIMGPESDFADNSEVTSARVSRSASEAHLCASEHVQSGAFEP